MKNSLLNGDLVGWVAVLCVAQMFDRDQMHDFGVPRLFCGSWPTA